MSYIIVFFVWIVLFNIWFLIIFFCYFVLDVAGSMDWDE